MKTEEKEIYKAKTIMLREDQIIALTSLTEQFLERGLQISTSQLVRLAIDEGLVDAAAKWFFIERENDHEEVAL